MKEFNSFVAADDERAGTGPVLLALVCAAVLAALSFNPGLFNDGDTSWHLAGGRLILSSGAVPHTDPFSFTFAGEPWVAHEWLAEVLMAGAHQLAGWSGLAFITGLSVAVLLAIVGWEALRHVRPASAVAAVVAVATVLMPFVVARPHVFAWPILAAWTALHLRRREDGQAPPLAAALIMLVWANLHGSFVLGLLLTGLFSLEALVHERDRARQFRQWATFGIAAAAASLLTPHGINGLLFPLQVSAMESLPLIGEWRPTDFGKHPAFGLLIVLVAALLLTRRPAISPLRLMLLAALLYLAIEHVRHQAVLAIVGSLVLVRAFGDAPRPVRVTRAAWTLMLLALGGLGILRLSVPAARPDSASNPLTAIAHVPADLRRRPVLNSYAFGGPLILSGIRPFIDGRGDMYGDAFMFEHRRMMHGDVAAFRQAARKWDIRWTILSPLDPLARKLDGEPGWRRIYSDRWAVVHAAN